MMHEAEPRMARYSLLEMTLIVQLTDILNKLHNPRIICDKKQRKLLSIAVYSRYQDLRSLGLEDDARRIISACKTQKSRDTRG